MVVLARIFGMWKTAGALMSRVDVLAHDEVTDVWATAGVFKSDVYVVASTVCGIVVMIAYERRLTGGCSVDVRVIVA
jgi:hypothetical protein